jgi:outer membrane murein-binding lipoprotein Lpp
VTVAIAVVTGGLALAGTYLNARTQRTTKRDELQAQRETDEQTRRGEALARRRENYAELLALDRELEMLQSTRRATREQFADWRTRFNRAHTMLILTGSNPARQEAQQLAGHVRAIQTRVAALEAEAAAAGDAGDLAAFGSLLAQAYDERAEMLGTVRDDLAATMRDDVTPEDLPEAAADN